MPLQRPISYVLPATAATKDPVFVSSAEDWLEQDWWSTAAIFHLSLMKGTQSRTSRIDIYIL